jgi:predicted nucleotidyltransferase
VEEVIIFGSRAVGNAKPTSDIDFALKGEYIDWKTIIKVKHLLDELPMVYDFDVMNYHTLNNPIFKEQIDSKSKQFYKK